MNIEKIVKRVKMGDNEAFEELYQILSKPALRTAYAILKDQYHSMDAVEETFLKVYSNIDKFNNSKLFKPWFYKILTNECYRIYNKNNCKKHKKTDKYHYAIQ